MSSILADQYEPKCGGGESEGGGVTATHGAQINFGDLTP
jgi:hypothetical protein